MVRIFHKLPVFGADGITPLFYVAQYGVPCGNCTGRGWRVKVCDQKAISRCDICEGRGWVPEIVCDACGRPAYAWKNHIWHCGRKECFEDIVTQLKIQQQMVRDDREPWRIYPGTDAYTCMC